MDGWMDGWMDIQINRIKWDGGHGWWNR